MAGVTANTIEWPERARSGSYAYSVSGWINIDYDDVNVWQRTGQTLCLCCRRNGNFVCSFCGCYCFAFFACHQDKFKGNRGKRAWVSHVVSLVECFVRHVLNSLLSFIQFRSFLYSFFLWCWCFSYFFPYFNFNSFNLSSTWRSGPAHFFGFCFFYNSILIFRQQKVIIIIIMVWKSVATRVLLWK